MTSLSLLYAHSVRPIPGKGRSSNPCPQLKAPVGQIRMPYYFTVKTPLKQESDSRPSEEARPWQLQVSSLKLGPHSGFLGSLLTRQISRLPSQILRHMITQDQEGLGHVQLILPLIIIIFQVAEAPCWVVGFFFPWNAGPLRIIHFGSCPFSGPVQGSLHPAAKPLCRVAGCPGPRGW